MDGKTLGALTLIATEADNDSGRGMKVSFEFRLDPHLQEMMSALNVDETAKLMALRRQIAQAAMNFFLYLRDPDSGDRAGE